MDKHKMKQMTGRKIGLVEALFRLRTICKKDINVGLNVSKKSIRILELKRIDWNRFDLSHSEDDEDDDSDIFDDDGYSIVAAELDEKFKKRISKKHIIKDTYIG